MAVYTPLSNKQIADILKQYPVGRLIAAEGILEGIDNTNYKIETTNGKYVLTVFENRIDPRDIPYFLDLMDHLSKAGIYCPSPVRNSAGSSIGKVLGKSFTIFPFIDGRGATLEDITPDLCEELGILLGKMHLAGQETSLHRPNSMGPEAWETRIKKTGPHGAAYLKEIEFVRQNWPTALPQGNAHADLFPDNVFLLNGHIHGVIDFYFSATDFLAYDLAIVCNAWCFDRDWTFSPERFARLLKGYESLRPLEQGEKDAFQTLCRGASLRFLSSRLHDLVFHDPKNLVTPKNPDEYIRKLEFHRDHKII